MPAKSLRGKAGVTIVGVLILLGTITGPARAQQAGADATVNFSNPPRDYREIPLAGWKILVETELLARDAELGRRALVRLEAKLGEMLAVLPQPAHADLQRLPIYLLYGPKSALGGWTNGASYFQRGAPDNHKNLDPRWRNVLVIKSAENYVALSELWALKVLVHEISHAEQLEHWPEQQPDILAAWQNAKSAGLYRNVTDDQGRHHDEAYALVNQLEYYAELSCMYFVRCNYPPTNRQELKAYDPLGYAMVEKIWNIPGGKGAVAKASATRAPAPAPVKREKPPPKPAPAPAAKEFRSWTDATGENRTEAEFADLTAGSVKLRKRDGTVIAVPLDRLSDEDRQWIATRGR